jgi:Ca2+-binding EF-hand superfamily protein
MPNNSNVVNFKNEYVSSEALKQWSMKYAKDNNIETSNFKVLRGRFNSNLTPEWVDYLLNKADISSVGMGVGRNNVTFTLALYFKSVDKTFNESVEALQSFNNRLSAPLSARELHRTVKSAFEGEYSGASREHVESLLEAFSDDEVVYNNSFVSINGWYKFAKPREQRTRSHYSEREEDLQAMLYEKTNTERVFLTGSTTNIAKALGMARSTFNVVIKQAQSNGTIIKRTIGKGRNAETFIALKSVYMERLFDLVKMVKDKKEGFSSALRGLLDMDKHTKDLMVQNPGLYEESINTFEHIEHMIEIRPSIHYQVAIGTRFVS